MVMTLPLGVTKEARGWSQQDHSWSFSLPSLQHFLPAEPKKKPTDKEDLDFSDFQPQFSKTE